MSRKVEAKKDGGEDGSRMSSMPLQVDSYDVVKEVKLVAGCPR